MAAKLLQQQVSGDYVSWAREQTLTEKERSEVSAACASLPAPPKFSVVMPVFDPDPTALEQAIQSVRAQIYPHWELCAVDDCSTAPHVWENLQAAARQEPRIKVKRRESNGHISAASNDALALADGDYVALLDHDDMLAPEALALAALEICANRELKLIYTDEDTIDSSGVRGTPHFKPGWDIELLRAQNYVCHLLIIKRELLARAGAFRAGFEGVQDWDLVLRCAELISASEVRHIERIMYHWRAGTGSTAASFDSKPYVREAQRRAVVDHLRRCGAEGEAQRVPGLPDIEVSYAAPKDLPEVTIALDVSGGIGRALNTASALLNYNDYSRCKLRFVGESEELLGKLYGAISDHRILRDAAGTRAVEAALFVQTGVLPESKSWLSQLVAALWRPGVGMVGARVVGEGGRILHNGYLLGSSGWCDGLRGRLRWDPGYMRRGRMVRQVAAVSSLCCLVRGEHCAADLSRRAAHELSEAVHSAGQRVLIVPQVAVTAGLAERFLKGEIVAAAGCAHHPLAPRLNANLVLEGGKLRLNPRRLALDVTARSGESQ